MNRRVKGALVGATAGALIGAVYGYLFVTYREMLARQQGVDDTSAQIPGGDLPDEPSAAERIKAGRDRAGYQAFLERARALREQDPDLRWQDAMKMARNGAPIGTSSDGNPNGAAAEPAPTSEES